MSENTSNPGGRTVADKTTAQPSAGGQPHGTVIEALISAGGFLARCLCGWNGPVRLTRGEASEDAAVHIDPDAALPPSETGYHRTPFRAPTWATERHDDEGGLRWNRVVEVETLPGSKASADAEPSTVRVEAEQIAELIVLEDGRVMLRATDVEVYVPAARMTPAQARTLAEATLGLVDAVEAAQR